MDRLLGRSVVLSFVACIAALGGLLAGLVVAVMSPELARAASTVGAFEIEGNIADDTGPGDPIDWATPPPNLTNFTDGTGSTDDGFGGGSKETQPGGWSCIQASAPGKDDILAGQIAFRTINGKQFVYVDYTRAAVNGDAHIDYEFHQSSTPNPACPQLPQRTAGDILISFDTENGGAIINVKAYRWTGNATRGSFTLLATGSQGTTWDGAVNIPNTIPGHEAGDFGEAVLNLTDTIGNIACGQFAGAYMKTRSSTSIASALQDRTQTRPINVGNCPALTVTKTADAPSVSSGSDIGFTITVRNDGQATATGVTLTDTLPSGTGISWFESPDNPNCSISGSPQVLTCNFGDLAPTQSASVHVVSHTTAATSGTFTNTATARATNNPPTSSTATTTVNKPNLTSSKVADAASVSSGQDIGFTITVSNAGPGTATGVSVNDPLPGGTGIDWFESPDNPNCSITGSPPNETLTCSFGDLAPGETRSVHVVSHTTTGTSGTFTNTATVTSTNAPPTTPSTSTRVNAPGLNVTKTADAATVSSGSPIGFTITVTNAGPGTATSVTLSDPLPGGAGIDWSESPDNPDCSITGAPPTETLTCSFGDIAPGGTETVHVSSPTTEATSGALANTVTVRATNSPDRTSTSTITVNQPHLVHTKVADNALVSSGSPIGFTLTVTNNGPGTATGVTINDPLPGGTGIDWFESPDNPNCSIIGSPPNETLTCSFGDLAPTQSRTVHVQSNTTAATSGTFSNTSVADATNHPPVTTTTVTITVNQPHVTATKTADSATVNPGSQIGYTITITNAGPGTATNVTVNDALPAGGGINWSLSPSVSGCSINGNPPTETLSCAFASLAPGTISIHVVSSTSLASCGDYANTATVSASNHATVTTNTSTITVDCRAILTISKSACPTPAVPGGVLTYTISFGNEGTAAANDVVVTDSLPAGTTVVDADGGTVEGNTVTWEIGTIGPGGSGSRTLRVLVDAPSGTDLVNSATISASNALPATTTTTLTTPVSNAGAITHGSAYSADADVLALALIDELGRVDSVAPGAPANEHSQVGPIVIPALVSLGLLINDSSSSVTDEATSTASSQVAAVNLLSGAITADIVRGESTSTADANFATGDSTGSTFANLRVFGVNNNQPLVDVQPNTTVDVRNPLLPTQILARAVLYEEGKTATIADGKFTSTHFVNMIHVTLLKPFLTLAKGAEIIVGHASTDATYPSGLACDGRPGLVSGNAYNAWVNGTVLGNQFVNVQVGDAEITPLGGSDADGIAANIPGVVTNATVANSASGSIAGNPTATSRSTAESINVLSALFPGGLVSADAIDVRSTSTTTSNSATTAFDSTFVNVRIANLPPLTVAPSPNATFFVSLPTGGFAVIVLNERLGVNGTKDTFGRINAIHVFVYSGLGLLTAEVIVGHAHSDAHHP